MLRFLKGCIAYPYVAVLCALQTIKDWFRPPNRHGLP